MTNRTEDAQPNRNKPKAKRKAKKAKRLPYAERSDLDKLQSQWNKLSGLLSRDEPSAAIVRCATAAEIAANYAIRHELARKSELEDEVVDYLLVWANGLRGKMERLFLPIYFVGRRKDRVAKALFASADKINKVRNEVVHQGRFSDGQEADELIAEAKRFIDLIVGLSVPGFDIQDRTRAEKE
jgi:hypothetical protein